MSHHFDPNSLQFYMTIPSPCPYLPGRLERKLFTQLDPFSGPQLNDYLTHAGFRRSQNVIYRPACEACAECRSLRVLARAFVPGRNLRRIRSRNTDLSAEVCEAYATREQFELLSRYLHSRHAGGGMTDMDYARYKLMVEDCAASTEIVEYRDPDSTLIACMIVDRLGDGLSLVYSFFDPAAARRSLGHHMIIDQIQRTCSDGLRYTYLGYWVEGSPKMDYKARYQPCEVLSHKGWARIDPNIKTQAILKP